MLSCSEGSEIIHNTKLKFSHTKGRGVRKLRNWISTHSFSKKYYLCCWYLLGSKADVKCRYSSLLSWGTFKVFMASSS